MNEVVGSEHHQGSADQAATDESRGLLLGNNLTKEDRLQDRGSERGGMYPEGARLHEGNREAA